jgi:hypothetical protein
MPEETEEIDYLAGAKLRSREQSFAEVTREAFLLAHQCLQDQDIAEEMELTGGRISQMLKEPAKLKPETIHKILACFESRVHRRNILKAWQKECFGEELQSGTDGLVGDVIDQATIRRIDRLIRQVRPDRALQVTREALARVIEPSLRRSLLDRAFNLSLRLDLMGDAMQTALTLYQWGRDEKNAEMMAAGLAMKARILRSIDSSNLEAVLAVHGEIRNLLQVLPPSDGPSFHVTATERLLQNEHVAAVLRFPAGGREAEEFLRTSLEAVRARRDASDSPSGKANSFHLEARLLMALSEPFLAEEALDKSFASGEYKSLSMGAKTGILKAKLLAARGEIEEAVTYYESLSRLCAEERNLYHLRLAQHDLALLLGRMFSPSQPA